MNISRFRSIAVGIVALFLAFKVLRLAGVMCAIIIRRHWPDAWFSGLIVFYADIIAAACALAISTVVIIKSWRRTSTDT